VITCRQLAQLCGGLGLGRCRRERQSQLFADAGRHHVAEQIVHRCVADDVKHALLVGRRAHPDVAGGERPALLEINETAIGHVRRPFGGTTSRALGARIPLCRTASFRVADSRGSFA